MKAKVTKPIRINLSGSVYAYAWKCDFGLCKWAASTAQQLRNDGGKPSPEAKIVCVRLIENAKIRS